MNDSGERSSLHSATDLLYSEAGEVKRPCPTACIFIREHVPRPTAPATARTMPTQRGQVPGETTKYSTGIARAMRREFAAEETCVVLKHASLEPVNKACQGSLWHFVKVRRPGIMIGACIRSPVLS